MISHYYISVLVLIIIACLGYGIWLNDYQEGIEVYEYKGKRYIWVGGRLSGDISGTIYGNTVTNQPGNITYDSTPNIRYDPNNYDTVFHAEFESQDSTLPPDKNSTVPGSAVYYQPGSFTYGASSYVPYYEDSVFLSRTNKTIVNAPTYIDTSSKGGFCSYYGTQPVLLEQKCNTIDSASCAATSCCVLLGGQKCVAGKQSGPTMKANYSDFLIKNKDFYYYQGKCYGNCPTPNLPVIGIGKSS